MVLSGWKKHFLEFGSQCFEKGKQSNKVSQEEKERSELFEQIGRLKMEKEWLKKKLDALNCMSDVPSLNMIIQSDL